MPFTNGNITEQEQDTYNAFVFNISEDVVGDVVQYWGYKNIWGHHDNSEIAGVHRVSYDANEKKIYSYRQLIGQYKFVDGVYTAIILNSTYSQMTKKHVSALVDTLEDGGYKYILVEELTNDEPNGDYAFPDEEFWDSCLRPNYISNNDSISLIKSFEWSTREYINHKGETVIYNDKKIFNVGEYEYGDFKVFKHKNSWYVYSNTKCLFVLKTLKEVREKISEFHNTFNCNVADLAVWFVNNTFHDHYVESRKLFLEWMGMVKND